MELRQSLHIPVLFLLVLFHAYPVCSTEIVPEASVTIVKKDAEDPEWKVTWDAARELANNKNFNEAIEQYKKVLALKPNIEEVKWELCKALIETGAYEKSALLLDNLLELDNRRVIYLVTAGRVAMLSGNPQQAATFYGQALEIDPDGRFSVEATKGFIEGLIAQGKVALALPLMEQLLIRGDFSANLLRKTAEFSLETGDFKKAGYYYRQLIEKYRVAPETLLDAASVYEKLNNIQDAVKLWEQYLELFPDSIEHLLKVSDFYLNEKKYNRALPYIVKLLELKVNREKYLLEAGRIFLYEKGRADKALGYYEQYRKEFPHGVDVQDKISDIQLILANDFLSIVENDGVWILWRDLAKMTPDRIGIYRAMGELLQGLQKKREYMEVLQIIHLHQPEDFDIALKLAGLYRDEKKYGKCLLILKPFEADDHDSRSYYLLKAECEKNTGNDNALLDTLTAYLKVFPDDHKIRMKAARLAGDLGKVSVLENIVGESLKEIPKSGEISENVTVYINGLIKNRRLESALRLIEPLIEAVPCCSPAWNVLTEKRARALKLQDRTYELEQELRRRATFMKEAIEPVLDLARNSLETGDISSLRIWLALAQKKISLKESSGDIESLKSRVSYLGMRFDELKGEHERYEKNAEEYLLKRKKNKHLVKADFNILRYLILQKYRQEKYSEGKAFIESYSKNFGGLPEYRAILNILNEKIEADDHERPYADFGVVELFNIVESLIEAGDVSQAEEVLKLIVKRSDNKGRAWALLAELYFENGRYEDALTIYEELHSAVPKEAFFENRLIECEYFSGKTDSFLSRIKENKEEHLSDAEITEIGKSISSPSTRRQLARVLWLKGNWQEALQVYSDLELVLKSKVSDSLQHLEKAHQQNLRNMLDIDFQESEFYENQELFGRILNSSVIAANFGNMLAKDLSGIYSSCKWYEVVKQEYAAKRALNSKRFYQAEKEYEELIEEESYGTDVYPDLATIYSRLGRHTKETEMIEKIKETSSVYSAMKTTVEKNVRERQPKIYYEGSYLKEEGRDGLKDLEKFYNGFGLRMQPTIFQQFGLEAGWNIYNDSSDLGRAESLELQGIYSIFFSDFLEAGGELGLEDMRETHDSFLKYKLYAKGTPKESVELHFGISQELVNDNREALSQGIYRRTYGAGIMVDPIPSLFMGFDFDVFKYSDSNEGKTYNVWTSYKYFTDTSRFDFTYRYNKIENELVNGEIIQNDPAGVPTYLSYWSPGDYWRHMLSFEYRLELWTSGRFYSGTSWLSAMYGIGYESSKSVVHLFEANIFLEINPMLLLKGTFILDRTEGYDRNEGFLSLAYRW